MQDTPRMTCKTFDNPLRILFWTMDFVVVVAPLLFLGVIFKSFYLLGAAFVFMVVYSPLKKKYGNQSLSHYIYAYFPTSVCQKMGYFVGLPPSHIQEMLLT